MYLIYIYKWHVHNKSTLNKGQSKFIINICGCPQIPYKERESLSRCMNQRNHSIKIRYISFFSMNQ